MDAEFVNPLDHKDNGKLPAPNEKGEFYLKFFVFTWIYPLGPCTLRMHFDAGGAMGVSFDVETKAIEQITNTVFRPWVSGKFNAELSLNILVAKAGIRLTGYIMKTSFPLTLSTNFGKQPVRCTKRLDAELVPLELILKSWVEILKIFKFDSVLWHWKADTIRGNIMEKECRKDDHDPPEFKPLNTPGPGYLPALIVRQVPNRHPHDPAFKLEFNVEDEDSDVKLWYAVGDYEGGTNVVGWTELRGESLLVPAILPCGIPLYFMVKARNSQGLESTESSSLTTYDCTFPDGRVDMAYKCTSHPHKLRANVIVFDDSELVPDRLSHGVGYSPSSHGHEVVDWLPLNLSNSQSNPSATGDLKKFSSPRPGRLNKTPLKTATLVTASACASECLKQIKCVSFTYNQYLHVCELQEVTEGASAERKPDGHFETYERLGKAYAATLRYENLRLHHGMKYYVNADINNVLGYRAVLTSEGTMVDYTPPEPGPLGHLWRDFLVVGGCNASIIQRCEDPAPSARNHRIIITGSMSSTIFNGNRKGQNMRHTVENYHVSANWDGFKDEECGIHGYTWAVGTTVCGTDVASFRDPHTSIPNPDDWTYTGLVKDLHLQDGRYYTTVQAVNDVLHGGDLVTTVCHSTPFVVDTSPPNMNSVEEFLFDESFRFLVVYYNATDDTSGIARMEFGLGKTKYDVMIRRYLPFEIRGQGANTYLVNEEFETEEGVPAWIRLKVVNNVMLSATGSSDSPILIDYSPPVPGDVLDGARLGLDICCQNSTTEICAQWVDFHDPESNIDSYFWGVGLTEGSDDIVPFTKLTSYDKQSCVHVQLQHNVTYFSTVVANNKALNTKSSNASSNGLLIDITPPVPGNVSDGAMVTDDEDYTSETATVTTSWAGFYDPESGLAPYSLSVFINDELENTFSGIDIDKLQYTDHAFSLQHRDIVTAELQATNRAGSNVKVVSDGMLVDHTPPDLVYMATENKTRYQQRDDTLDLTWEFQDLDSGIAEYRCQILELFQGRKSKFWPVTDDNHVIRLNATSPPATELHLDGVKLQNGAAYSLKVTALNRAKMATSEESEGVTIDTTPPVILEVIF
ncbi:hypothetical protein BaRGS_00015066 [Batillaria attramentaria]|uniref:Apple domain-containing protein n=1 Tax=Batillaria attramentaria TaxID=370345 RepID=A0ABD0L3Y7_9CAEN